MNEKYDNKFKDMIDSKESNVVFKSLIDLQLDLIDKAISRTNGELLLLNHQIESMDNRYMKLFMGIIALNVLGLISIILMLLFK